MDSLDRLDNDQKDLLNQFQVRNMSMQEQLETQCERLSYIQQAITQSDDLETSISRLEHYNWNLEVCLVRPHFIHQRLNVYFTIESC